MTGTAREHKATACGRDLHKAVLRLREMTGARGCHLAKQRHGNEQQRIKLRTLNMSTEYLPTVVCLRRSY